MGFENLFSGDFKKIELPPDENVVYIIGVRDCHKGFFPFYVGKTIRRRLIARIGDYYNARFSWSEGTPLPDFHVGRAIQFFQSAKKAVEVRYKLTDDPTAEEEWKSRVRLAIQPHKFQFLEERIFDLKQDRREQENEVKEFCTRFLASLDQYGSNRP